MAEPKTKKTKASVTAFLNTVTDPERRKDCKTLVSLMKRITGSAPSMWGDSIVGFGSYHYKYASGREGDWPEVAFSPRKQNLTVYVMTGFDTPLMKKLGSYKTGKSCLYLNRLADIDLGILEQLIRDSVARLRKSS